MSLYQLEWWADQISSELEAQKKDRLAIKAVLFAAPQTLALFRKTDRFRELQDVGVRFSPACCETIFETRMLTGKPIITNSNKLRAYTTARYFEEQDLLEILVSGQVGG